MPSAFPPALERLIKNFSKLPGIGEKSATRLALQVLRWPEGQAAEFAESIAVLHSRIRLCSSCHTFSEQDPCPVCADPRRDASKICVVEDPGDLLAMEKAGAFNGLYHVLHGVLAPMDGIGPDQLKLKELMQRVEQRGGEVEVIIATSSTAAGEATASFLSDMLAEKGVRTSRIACGIPMGMDLKYADKMTLQRALEARIKY